VIGRQSVLAGQVGVQDHARLGEGTIVGAQSGVSARKAIERPGQVYFGSPARPLRQHLKELAALARLTKERESSGKGDQVG
jgi:UDP-3-O-[3-hydroxymyristoyl] glucosamine N-acyltransferase